MVLGAPQEIHSELERDIDEHASQMLIKLIRY